MISITHLLILGLVLICCFFAGKFLFQQDTKIENRRRAAAKLAATLQSMGLRKTPDFLIDYSVGDYSGMASKIASLSELFLSGEAAVVTEFDAVFKRVFEAKLKSPEGLAWMRAMIDEHDSKAS